MNNKNSVSAIVFIVGAYLICQMLADIGATRLVEIWGVVLPGGTFVFAFTFTLRDIIHKRLGVEWARVAIFAAAVFNVFMSGYLVLIAKIKAPVFFELGEQWNSIFAIVPAITIASIIAEVVSELVDTEVYHLVKTKLPKWPQWLRVLISNGVSLPLDSLVFGVLGFVWLPVVFGAEKLPFSVAMGVVGGQIIWKAIVTVLSMPGIYLVKEKTG